MQANQQMILLKKQAELIMQQVKEIEERLKISELIYQAEMRFKPVLGQTYHLYENETGDYNMSIIAPDEWGKTNPNKKFVSPDHKTRSTWKSDTSPGGAGFNEIMFEDLKQRELVWMQAQKNLRKLVKNDETITIGHDRQKYVVNNETETTGVNRIEVTGVNRTEITDKDRTTFVGTDSLKMVWGDESEKTDGNMMLLVEKDQDIVIRKMKRERVEKDANLHVVGNRNERVDGTLSLTVDRNHHEKIVKNSALEAGEQIHFKAGSAMIIEATNDLTIKGPGGFIRIDSSGVTIRGTLVRINSGGSAGSGAGARPEEPEAAKVAVIEEPPRPKPIDLLVEGIGQ